VERGAARADARRSADQRIAGRGLSLASSRAPSTPITITARADDRASASCPRGVERPRARG
jgi:hypothetical protein